MEHLAKAIAAVCALALAGCAGPPIVKIVDPPKPTVDARILQTCDVTLTPIDVNNPSPEQLYFSYGEALNRLNNCACRHLEARNALCKLTAPGCSVLKSCEKPNESSQ